MNTPPSHCDKCGQAKWLPGVMKATNERVRAALRYCYPHVDQMWAASIVGILLGCDFRDAKAEIKKELGAN